MLGDLPPVAVGGNRAMVGRIAGGVDQIFPVVAHGQHQLVGHQVFVHQVQRQLVSHFPHDEPCLVGGRSAVQYLAAAAAVGGGLVGLDVRNGAGFPAPGVVDEQLGVDAE